MSIYKDSLSALLDGWSSPPASRRTDPKTSKQAEAQINLGQRQKRARQVLELVNRYPNRTSGELSCCWYLGRHFLDQETGDKLGVWLASFLVIAETPHKRLPDLEKLGLVERGASRKCTDSGKECSTWHITERGRRELEN